MYASIVGLLMEKLGIFQISSVRFCFLLNASEVSAYRSGSKSIWSVSALERRGVVPSLSASPFPVSKKMKSYLSCHAIDIMKRETWYDKEKSKTSRSAGSRSTTLRHEGFPGGGSSFSKMKANQKTIIHNSLLLKKVTIPVHLPALRNIESLQKETIIDTIKQSSKISPHLDLVTKLYLIWRWQKDIHWTKDISPFMIQVFCLHVNWSKM